MPLYVAQMLPDAEQPTAFVTSFEDLNIALVCTRVAEGEWVPQFAVKKTGEREGTRLQLPSCFTLDPDAIVCLEGAYSGT